MSGWGAENPSTSEPAPAANLADEELWLAVTKAAVSGELCVHVSSSYVRAAEMVVDDGGEVRRAEFVLARDGRRWWAEARVALGVR